MSGEFGAQNNKMEEAVSGSRGTDSRPSNSSSAWMLKSRTQPSLAVPHRVEKPNAFWIFSKMSTSKLSQYCDPLFNDTVEHHVLWESLSFSTGSISLLVGEETLFIVDDCIVDENLDKRKQSLLELTISGRHRKHSLWFLTQSYTALPKKLRWQKKQLILWYPNKSSDKNLISNEREMTDDWEHIKAQLKKSKHAYL